MTRVVALSGGVGGAKLALGLADTLADTLAPDVLLVAVNTGDDFEHLGLTICPDIDSNVYALAGLRDLERGWGRRDESWQFMTAAAQLGGATWFQLGDRDLAMHVLRTQRLRQGASLTEVTRELAQALGVTAALVPVSDDTVATMVITADERLGFQEYFVQRRCQPAVRDVEYAGAQDARVSPALLAALADPALECVLICPSNPWLSIGPMLAMPALRQALAELTTPVVAVSPIVGGRALKGPAAKIMRELGLTPGNAAIASYYGRLIDGLVIDRSDAGEQAQVTALGVAVSCVDTVMPDRAAGARLACDALDFAARLAVERA